MNKTILIVEDNYVEASNLQRILAKAGYIVLEIAMSVKEAICIAEKNRPDLVLIDIFLKGPQTGIELAYWLCERNIAFVYLSANSNQEILSQAKKTEPYGFLVKPFREKDVLVTLDIAAYLHEQKQKLAVRKQIVSQELFSPSELLPGIVGKSIKLQHTLDMIRIVAPTDTSVLIVGESGTGKERVVDCIHSLSSRKSKPLVKINCAALPASLIDSELFGHEKGAFTGAYERRIGKFEQASGGTIFLDEIGEMTPDLQIKLLRVLQEKEIDRIGGKTSIKINARVVAATNKNLETEVEKGRFRMDLFYRLNVFPITVPALRERKDDIPLLVRFYLNHFNKELGRNVKSFSEKAMADLMQYNWPGNVRELEHFIQRSVLLAQEETVKSVELPKNQSLDTAHKTADDRIRTMEENDIDHITKALKVAKGKLAGPGGAAELLNLPYSTLVSKIRKLGIKKV
ncbi:sigma-54-dependent transcriptional regulator [Dyadobacter subterraneus]|uniref:Sigma-54-dependent Fis family transcriptional regulator n=1 Tax=Dyadobacter subterraneus TaxID=2773304 RepID=A0ABR9W890_9BACT|nr:sigma-54 dependent transcriptional regulator [Dyadobacter subterraneus]MBE9461675.1 sigma-54-dependent Fis family transcriptional regulator [Dyadobacter subterraneus]